VEEIIGRRLGAAAARDELRAGIEIDLERLHLASTVAGLTDRLLADAIPPERALATIDLVLARVFREPPTGAGRPGPRLALAEPPGDTALRIVRVAERHFAEKGIDGASLREITREAGQANRAAVNYYFGDRRGLVRAVIARHRRDEEAHRNALLDAHERAGTIDRRAMAEALVLPLAAKLDDPDGGRAYLQVTADYYLHVTREENTRFRIPDSSIVRWHRLLDASTGTADAGEPGPVALPRLLAIRLALLELSLLAARDEPSDTGAAIAFLVNAVEQVLANPFPGPADAGPT
jgi:AcrR family transcriptional regulator